MLELLLKAGADPTARMYGGRTPLGSALLRPNPILARLLRAHGAPEPEDEDDKLSPCSSSSSSDSDSDSDNRDEGVSWDWVSQLEGQGKPVTRKPGWMDAVRESRGGAHEEMWGTIIDLGKGGSGSWTAKAICHVTHI